MGLFSKIAKGIKRGTASGFASLGRDLEEEQSTRRQMRTTAFGGIEGRAIGQAGEAGFGLDLANLEALGGSPEFHDVYAQQAGEKVQRDNEAFLSGTDKFLTQTGLDSYGRPIYDPSTFPQISKAVQEIQTQMLKTEQYLERQGSSQSPYNASARQNLADMQARYTELLSVVDTMTGSAGTRKQNAEMVKLLQSFGTQEGLNKYKSFLTDEVGLDAEGAFYNTAVSKNIEANIVRLADAGAWSRARQLAKGLSNEIYLTEMINIRQAQQEQPGLVSTAASIVTSTTDQASVSNAYSAVAALNDSPKKVMLMGVLETRSMQFLVNQQREAVIAELEVRSNIVNKLNQMRIQQNANVEESAARRGLQEFQYAPIGTAIEAGERPELLELVGPDSPEVVKELRRQMNAMFPAMAARKQTERQTRALPGMSVADVEAIKGLQQVNIGKSYDEIVFNMNNSEHLTLKEKIETKQIMDRVGEELGFDVLQSKTDDAAYLNRIHAGIPSWADSSKEVEDNLVLEYGNTIDEEHTLRPISQRSGTLNVFYPNAIQEARTDLEVRETMGLLPVGATDRVVKRLTAKYLGDEGMAKMTDGDAETTAPTTPAPTETDPLPYKRYGRESAEALGIRGFGDEVKSIVQSIIRTVDKVVDADLSSFAKDNEMHMSTDEALNRKYAAAFKLHRSDWLKYKDAIDEEHSGGSRNSGVGDFTMREQRMGFNR